MKRGFNAISGIIILVAITVLIASVVYLAIENKGDAEVKDKSIFFDIKDYNINSEGNVSINLSYVNDFGEKDVKLNISMNVLDVADRVVCEEIPIYVDSYDLHLEKGGHIEKITLPSVKNFYYVIEAYVFLDNNEHMIDKLFITKE